MKTIELFTSTFQTAIRYFPATFRRTLMFILVLLGTSIFFNQYFGLLLNFGRQQSTNLIDTLFPQIGLICWGLIEGLLLSLIIPVRMEETLQNNKSIASGLTFKELLKRYGLPLTAESLRVLASVILWSLLLIIPGIFKQIRYFFVPFVVLFDSEYQASRRDALNRSNELVRGITLPFVALVIVYVLIFIFIGKFLQANSIFERPILVIGISGLSMALSVFSNCWLYALYKARVQQIDQMGQPNLA